MADPWAEFRTQPVAPATAEADPWAEFRAAPAAAPAAEVAPPQLDQYQQAALAARDKERAAGLDTDSGYGRQAIQGLTLGFGDEVLAGLRAPIEMIKQGTLDPREGYNYAKAREDLALQDARERHGLLGTAAELAGGLVSGGGLAKAGLSARFAGSELLPRVAAGIGDGAALGGLYGFGSGSGIEDRATEAAKGAGIGGFLGGAFPILSSGIGRAYEVVRNGMTGNRIAQQAGASPETLRMLGNVMDADGSLGAAGQANMARAGSDAMLADAGPNARTVLDTAIQRGGPGAIEARTAISGRTAQASKDIASALDDALGQPQGITASRTAIRQGSAPARSNAYDAAYAAPIDYAAPQGKAIEEIVKTRVPQSAISEANGLMRAEGNQSQQILAKVADNGAVTFERLPDVRQLDYITRGLREVADQADGAGKLGGSTAKGRAYSNLAQEIRGHMKDLVPEYGKALEVAADPIRRSQAIDLGSKLLSPSMARDQVAEAVRGMSGAEKAAVAQGIRSQLDDAMARVTRTVQDGSTEARESVKAIKDLSSRANREKLAMVIGEPKASALFDKLNQAATSFDLRASVAENSKTFARQATTQRIADVTKPGPIGTAAQGEPINATKRIVQMLTGQTPEKVAGRQDAIYSELARLLTRPGGAGPDVYNAIRQLGATDQATQLTRDKIIRLLSGPQISYPATMLSTGTPSSR